MASELWAARDGDGVLFLYIGEPLLLLDGRWPMRTPHPDQIELDAEFLPDLAPGAKRRVWLVMETTAGECGGLEAK